MKCFGTTFHLLYFCANITVTIAVNQRCLRFSGWLFLLVADSKKHFKMKNLKSSSICSTRFYRFITFYTIDATTFFLRNFQMKMIISTIFNILEWINSKTNCHIQIQIPGHLWFKHENTSSANLKLNWRNNSRFASITSWLFTDLIRKV